MKKNIIYLFIIIIIWNKKGTYLYSNANNTAATMTSHDINEKRQKNTV